LWRAHWRHIRESRGLNMEIQSGQSLNQVSDEVQSDTAPLDVLLTILRPEIVEAASTPAKRQHALPD